MTTNYYCHSTSMIDEPCEIGEGTKIWHFSHIMRGVKIGRNCVFGQNCHEFKWFDRYLLLSAVKEHMVKHVGFPLTSTFTFQAKL